MTAPPPGWFPDPADPRAQRYWDGTAWSQHSRPVPGYPAPPTYPQAPLGGVAPAGPAAATLWQRNQVAVITVGVCVLYVVVAVYAHFAFIGILPVILTIRSFRRREPFAVVALLATIIAVVISLAALAR